MSEHTDEFAQRLATVNLNNHRTEKGQRPDLIRVADQADVIVCQEATWMLDLPGYVTHQPRRRNGAPAGEAILVRKGIPTRNPGSALVVRSEWSSHEHPCSDRFLVWISVLTPLGWVRVLDVHRLPRDYPGSMRAPLDAALRARTRLRRRWLAGGDFNDVLPKAQVVGEHLAGPRIDLWFGSPAMKAASKPGPVLRYPNRTDDHVSPTLVLASENRLPPGVTP